MATTNKDCGRPAGAVRDLGGRFDLSGQIVGHAVDQRRRASRRADCPPLGPMREFHVKDPAYNIGGGGL